MEATEEQQKLLDTAMALEKVALEDEYFVQRNLYPNVDFYSGIIFLAMGIPMNMFTVIFAMARTIGWISQWNEMMSDSEAKIGRRANFTMVQSISITCRLKSADCLVD